MNLTTLLEQLEKLEIAATPGPWDQRCPNGFDNMAVPKCVWSEYGFVSTGGTLPKEFSVPDAALIAESRNALPQLIPALRDAIFVITECESYSDEPSRDKARAWLEKWVKE